MGRPEREIGAHVSGHNSDSIGIVWVGRDAMDARQRVSLLNLLRVLMLRYALTPESVFGHRELATGKTCPNLNMDGLRLELRPSTPIGSPT
jgi:N-acetyl-anhydromuramyl-L-alanine amidase AmpD